MSWLSDTRIAEGTIMSLPKKILVPTDFSAHAERALDYALALADKLQAQVQLLHSYEIPLLSVPDAPWVVSADVVATIESAATTALDGLVAERKRPAAQLTAHLKMGDPRNMIEAAVAELGCDMVCMGTHGRRGITRMLLGSVAEYVVRTSTVPVLTIHTPDKK
jgi:nucleotide-binding universal stress UspA family protein